MNTAIAEEKERRLTPALYRRFGFFALPSVFQAAVSFGILPLTTAILSPSDYGAFALATVIGSFGVAIAAAPCGYLLSANYPAATPSERVGLVSASVWSALALVVLFHIALLIGWPHLRDVFPAFQQLTPLEIKLALLTAALTVPWVIALDVVTLDARARAYSVIVIGQTLAVATVTLIGLYGFGVERLALFFGGVAGALFSCLGATIVLRPSWCFVLPADYRRQLRTLFPAAVGGNIGENVQLLVERNLLATHLGFGPLGLYVHSQQYRAMAQWCVKAVGRTIWPVTLADAREDRDFQLTASAWNLAFTALSVGGIFFALFGHELVAALTHGKFTAAAPLIAGWLAVLLIQNTGKPQVGLMYAAGQVRTYTRQIVISMGVGVALLWILIPRYGAAGAFAAILLQHVTLRILVHHAAARIRGVPFQDQLAVFGAAITLSLVWVRQTFEIDPLVRIVMFATCAGGMILLSSRRRAGRAVAAAPPVPVPSK